MHELPWEKRFHFRDGAAAQDLAELKAKIESISYDEFYRHVNQEKNDFANWVEHILHKRGLADRLRSVSSIVETVELLNEETEPAPQQEERHDLQARIEQQLFAEPPAPTEEAPEISIELPEEELVLQEPKLPPKEEVEFAGRMPGPPMTTREPAHTSIRELDERHAARAKEHEMRFFVRHFLYGFLFGVFVGVILGRVLSILW
jgi:hypothetical protein